jgi:hypothetical protein|tara:strand:- start:5073 stop:5525 length:453 start_codon:yes stop_codon:yes gene_type:complete
MKNEEKSNFWQSVESRLRQEAVIKDEFPPFLHNRIMASVREESELNAQPKWAIFSSLRIALAGGIAGLVLLFVLISGDSLREERLEPQILTQIIITVSQGEKEVSNLLSNKTLDQLVSKPYQQQLDSIINEFENAYDFTVKMMPIELARN